jgi:large subunit ribosomal protein L22
VEAKASLIYLRATARKVRLVADEVRGKTVGDALSLLQFAIHKAAAKDVSKLIKSAVANMQSMKSDTPVDAENLKVKTIMVDPGPTQRRFRARAQGRVGRILKRSCRISVTISN